METASSTPVTESLQPPRRPRRRRRIAIVAVAVLLAILLLLLLLGGPTTSPSSDALPDVDDELVEALVVRDPNTPPDGVVALDSVGNGWAETAGFSVGNDESATASGGSSEPEQPDGGPDSPDDPCAGAAQSGALLAVTPDPHTLPVGATESNLTIINCGDTDVDWTAHTVPSVSLASEAGTIAGGAHHELGFAIDEDVLSPDFSFKIKVSEPDHNTYVDVHAFKPGFATPQPPEPPAGELGLTNGGPTGCALQCITKAWLTPNYSTPNPALEVRTNTPANIAVYVSQSAPVNDVEGNPMFPGVDPIGYSDGLETEWHTVVAPLEPGTHYHIIVKATDADDGRSYRAGDFTTSTPAEGPGEFAGADEAGCSVQCITKAWVTPGHVGQDTALEVKTHTAATLDVFVSANEPTLDSDDNPSFPGLEPVASSDGPTTEWGTELAGLEMGTTYHIIVRATDAEGHRSFRAGTFATNDAPMVMVTFHYVRVTHDGDSSPGNRGELSFGMAVDDTLVARTAEDKIHSDRTVMLNDGDRLPGVSYFAQAGDWLPAARMDATERDADLKAEFCSAGVGVPFDWGHNDDCDWKWNVASSGLRQTASLGSLDDCAGLGVDASEFSGNHCVKLETESHGSDYPGFYAIVSFRLATS